MGGRASSPAPAHGASPPGAAAAPSTSGAPAAAAAAAECGRLACALQDCLAAHDYQQARCARALDALMECCEHAPPGTVQCAFGGRRRATGD
jgi:hypothetical protein